MTENTPAGDQSPRPPAQPAATEPRIRVGSVAGFLAIVPHLLGFHPARSMVVVGVDARRGRVLLAFRYDLPDPPDAAGSREITRHAVGVLAKRRIRMAIVAGYGPGPLVTPVAEALQAGLSDRGIALRDLLRVEDGRYWSFLCQDPRCCPAEGVPFDAAAHPAGAALAAAGMPACPDRAALARSLAPLSGPDAESMARATERALRRVGELLTSAPSTADGLRRVVDEGRAAVCEAIAAYRAGARITDHDRLAWLTVTVADLRVRDDAWARMEPGFRAAHRRLWTDLVRHAVRPYVPAPASLLAFTAWQSGEGALANIAIERALAADPKYSMARLLGQALDAGLPPSAARLPMTPEEVEASYAGTDRAERADRAGRGGRARRPASARSSSARGATTRPASRRPSA